MQLLLDLVLDQLGDNPKEGVKRQPLLELESEEVDDSATESEEQASVEEVKKPVPKKMKTPTPSKKKAAKSSAKKDVPSVVSTARSSFEQFEEDHINELLPRCYELGDNEHLFCTGFPVVVGHTKKNRHFEFADAAESIAMMVLIPKSQRHTKGLLEGYEGCDEGTQWYRFLQLKVADVYGGREPDIDKEAPKYKSMYELHLPYEVEKKFFKTTKGGKLTEIPAPLLQTHTNGACFSFWLKKRHIEEVKADGKEVEGAGDAAKKLLDQLERMSMGGPCKLSCCISFVACPDNAAHSPACIVQRSPCPFLQ